MDKSLDVEKLAYESIGELEELGYASPQIYDDEHTFEACMHYMFWQTCGGIGTFSVWVEATFTKYYGCRSDDDLIEEINLKGYTIDQEALEEMKEEYGEDVDIEANIKNLEDDLNQWAVNMTRNLDDRVYNVNNGLYDKFDIKNKYDEEEYL